MRKKLIVAAKAAVTLVLLALVVKLTGVDDLLDNLKWDHPWHLLSFALCYLLATVAGAASWHAILRRLFGCLPFKQVLREYVVGMFFNNFLPSNMGGDVVKGCRLVKSNGSAPKAVWSLVLDRGVNFAALLLIGVFCLWPMWWVQAAVIAVACAGLCFKLTRGVTLWALVSQNIRVWSHVFIILALGLDIPWGDLGFVIPALGIASALPISIGGLGVREVAARQMGSPLGLESADLVLLSLGGYAVIAAVNLLGAIPLLLPSFCARQEK